VWHKLASYLHRRIKLPWTWSDPPESGCCRHFYIIKIIYDWCSIKHHFDNVNIILKILPKWPTNFKIFWAKGGGPLVGYAQVSVKYLPTVFKRWWLLATYFSNIAPYSSPYWQPWIYRSAVLAHESRCSNTFNACVNVTVSGTWLWKTEAVPSNCCESKNRKSPKICKTQMSTLPKLNHLFIESRYTLSGNTMLKEAAIQVTKCVGHREFSKINTTTASPCSHKKFWKCPHRSEWVKVYNSA
jgi:hypothetical protein